MNKAASIHPTCIIDENVNVGVGKSTYIHAEGKYKNYKNTKCIYAVNLFENKGSIIKQKCKLE